MTGTPRRVEALRAAFVVDAESFGTAEASAARLLHHLPSWVRPSLVVSQDVAGFFGRQDDVSVVPLARGRTWAPDAQAALERLNPDVVHVNLASPYGNVAALRAAESVAPTVVTLHADGPLPGEVGEVYERLAAAIAPMRSLTHPLTELGVPPHRVRLVRPGVEIPASPVPPAVRNPVVVGAFGPLTEDQGIDLLIQAVATLARRGRRLQLVIAGDGPERAKLIDRARGLPVRFVGPIADAGPLLRRLDVFCLPARVDVPPSPLLNAMAHGVPCLTTAVGDAVDILAGTASIVPPDDAAALAAGLERLVADAGLRAKVAREARELAVREFDIRRVGEEVGDTLLAATRV